MNKKEFTILFIIFSVLFILPIWLVNFLPFVDLPQHLNFVHILRNYHNPDLNYNKIYSLRLFPMHNTLHLFFNYLLSLVFPLEIANKIYVTISILLFPLALWFLIKRLGGNEQFSLLGFLLSYNYNLFWGFMGVNVGMALTLFLIGLEITSLNEKSKSVNLWILTILFILLFLCHSLVYIFSAFTYFLILLFMHQNWRRKMPLMLPLVISFLVIFLPWQVSQFRGEGSELQEQVRQYISPKVLYQNLLNLFQRIGIKTDQSLIFIFKSIFILAIFSTLAKVRQKGVGYIFKNNYRIISFFLIAALLFYLFFPGTYTEAVFLNERFAPLLFLLFIALLSINFSRLDNQIFKFILICIITFTGINITLRFIGFDTDTKELKTMFAKLNEKGKLVGLFYEKHSKPDYFGYDTYIHLPCYYPIYRQGFCGFSFAYIRYSPIVYNEPYPLPRIDEWTTWNSIFPKDWTIYDYFLVRGEPRLQDEDIFKKLNLLEEKNGWRIYENEPVKQAWAEIQNWLNHIDLSGYNYLLLPPLINKNYFTIPSHLRSLDYQTATVMISNEKITAAQLFPGLAIWLKDDSREYVRDFQAMNTGEKFQIYNYRFTPIYQSQNGFLLIYDIR